MNADRNCEENMGEERVTDTNTGTDVRAVIRDAIREFIAVEQSKAEPAYKAELMDERRRREQLELRVNELVEENRRARQAADESDRNATIRTELQRLGVNKVDLAYRAVRDDIVRSGEGQLVARGQNGELSVREYLEKFVQDNPELLPARIGGGSGAAAPKKSAPQPGVDLDKIRPGMSQEELDRARREIARVAAERG
jgi:hypothetical protein